MDKKIKYHKEETDSKEAGSKKPGGKKNLLMATIVVAIVAVVLTTVAFAANGGIELISNLIATIAGDDGDIPYAEFINTPNNTPDLYVKKVVRSGVDGVELPADVVKETEFYFTVKVNGDYYREQEYKLYDADMKEIKNLYSDEKVTDVEIPWVTDGNGGFVLHDGQTAKFEEVGKDVPYEVFEELPEDSLFRQVDPPANTHATGTIGEAGSTVTFTNAYYPQITTAEYTELRVSKTIYLPTGFEIPETPEFTFALKLKSKPYASEGYTLLDSNGDMIEYGVTDEKGQFKLKGGQTALFEDIETGLDYEVTEVMDGVEGLEGWRQVGKTTYEGGTVAPLVQTDFTNAIGSFAISKKMGDSSVPDAEFTFVLSVGGTPTQGEYYLYEDGVLVAPQKGSTYKTDTNGQFKLKANQTALFIGIDVGQEYNIKEIVPGGYKQITPTSPDGFSDTVREDTLPTWKFVNAEIPDIRVTFVKQDTSGEHLTGVKFKLKNSNGQFATLEEKDRILSITGWDENGTDIITSEDGEFIITGFDIGEYTLVETEALSGFDKMEDVQFSIDYETDPETGEVIDSTLLLTGERGDVSVKGTPHNNNAVMTLVNGGSAALPNTGGFGTSKVLALGLMLCAAGLMILALNRKKKRDQ